MPTDDARVNEYLETLKVKLDAYNDILGKQAFLAGEVRFFLVEIDDSTMSSSLQSVTLADIFHLPYATIVIEELGYDVLDGRPNVAR